MLWAQHSGRAARLQESRAEAGVVAVPRTEAQRMAVQDDCAERPRGQLCGMTVQRGLEDGCVGQLCRQRGPEDGCEDRGAQRQRQACCMQTRSE